MPRFSHAHLSVRPGQAYAKNRSEKVEIELFSFDIRDLDAGGMIFVNGTSIGGRPDYALTLSRQNKE